MIVSVFLEPPGLTSGTFFDLVDAVLTSEKVGRQPLTPGGPQRRIVTVEPDDRVLQILAGPGSGKTEMLVWRILYELLVIGSPADSLVVTTFTNKAATELEIRLVERCDQLLEEATAIGISIADPHVHDVRVGTLHSLCDSLLREFDAGYMESGTRLVDEHETLARMAREYRWKLGYAARGQAAGPANVICDTPEAAVLFRPPWETERWPITDMQRVELLRNAIAQHTETWLPRCGANGDRNGIEFVSPQLGITDALRSVYEKWTTYLDEHNILDFATIQQRFLERQRTVLRDVRHVFVDEFQDTNPIQLAIHVGWLTSDGTRLTVVGDDDQSIYRFRGSDIACFQGLRMECERRNVQFRLDKLEDNHRSSQTIVRFNEKFRTQSILGTVSMPKHLQPANTAPVGTPVRLLTGDWSDLCEIVATELTDQQARTSELLPDAAVLMFSTSERNTRDHVAPAFEMRNALEGKTLRVFNARNKTAALPDSPVHDLLALISYLIDPVRVCAVPGKTRPVEVFASHREAVLRVHATTAVPQFSSDAHAKFQKRFRKGGTRSLAQPPPDRVPLIDYVDDVRTLLANYDTTAGDRRRLTLSAFVARLMSFPFFRGCGYTPTLFRQALFTSLLEANIAPTRRTMRSLDEPMRPTVANGKVEWPRQYWDLLRVMGTMLEATALDDEEVEAFAENAIALLTFHQSKGLEFDHVYVAATGRDVMPANALRTALFSGRSVSYIVRDGQAETHVPEILDLAAADRERETYVALTRAKRTLTILCDPSHGRLDLSRLNPALAAIFDRLQPRLHPLNPSVTMKSFNLDTPGATA